MDKKEVEVIVQDYFKMLQLEIEEQKFNKSAHRRSLIPLLNRGRDKGIEFKHQNISAVLANMGLPFIKGYKPLGHYQQLLEDEVAIFLRNNHINLEQKFERFANTPAISFSTEKINFESIIDDEPIISKLEEDEPTYKPIKTNYLEKEQNNRKLGEEGEKLVIAYERWRLINAGKDGLAEKIEWVSKDLGDGTGYDILSKNINGTDRFVEVKTTKLIKETPIYLTKKEMSFASIKAKNFYLYRVFNFNTNPQLFIKNGQYKDFCKLIPETFKGYF